MICPTCGYTLKPFDRVCPGCRQPVPTAVDSPPPTETAPSQFARVGGNWPPPPGSVGLTSCPACRQTVSIQAAACPHCGQPLNAALPSAPDPFLQTVAGGNDSGMGAAAVLPPELRGFNWGAFLLNVIWGIAHNTWIGLLALVPSVNLVMIFVLGFKGNEWAWQNRRWQSIEQFRTVQRIWTNWGISIAIVHLVIVAGLIALVFIAGLGDSTSGGSSGP